MKYFRETLKSFLPNLSRLKRKDSSKIGVKEESRSHRQKLADSRLVKTVDSKKDAHQSGSNSNNNNHVNNENSDSKKNNFRIKKMNMDYSDESVKSHYQIRPNGSGVAAAAAAAAAVAGPMKTSSNSSNNTSAIGCNENCRLTISFQNRTASFQKLVKNSVELDGSVSSRFRGTYDDYDVRYESSRNLSSKIWSWISSQNYLNDNDANADEELESLHKISTANPVLKQFKNFN